MEILLNEDGTVRVLMVATAEMKKACRGADPSIYLCDTTFKFESRGYKLCSLLYLNPITNKGEMAQMSFLSDETEDSYTFAFNATKKIIRRNPAVLMIDKDFTEIAVIQKLFPSTTILLCWFHVLKFWKTLLSTARVDQDVRAEIMDSLRKLLYSRNQELFTENLTAVYTLIQVLYLLSSTE